MSSAWLQPDVGNNAELFLKSQQLCGQGATGGLAPACNLNPTNDHSLGTVVLSYGSFLKSHLGGQGCNLQSNGTSLSNGNACVKAQHFSACAPDGVAPADAFLFWLNQWYSCGDIIGAVLLNSTIWGQERVLYYGVSRSRRPADTLLPNIDEKQTVAPRLLICRPTLGLGLDDRLSVFRPYLYGAAEGLSLGVDAGGMLRGRRTASIVSSLQNADYGCRGLTDLILLEESVLCLRR
jgi:hypothetical protein